MTNWILFAPEFTTLLTAVLFLGLSFGKTPAPGRDFRVALGLAALGVIVCLAGVRLEGSLFADVYRVDLFSQLFKLMLSGGLFLVVCLCRELEGVPPKLHPEFYLLLFVCTLAMMLLVSSVHLLSVYVSLELSSYSLYILVGLRRERAVSLEAALKYFLVGICASALMLFGMALLYGALQATYLDEIARALPGAIERPVVLVGLLLTLCGFFFKLAVFPFHFWAPDVYEGAANQVSTYIATVSKVAAIALLVRTLSLTGDGGIRLVEVLAALSIVSMTLGNLTALVQKDLKRLLAYSSIAQAGYVLIGILAVSPAGYSAAVFYALALLVMKFTCFLVVVNVACDGRNLAVEQLAGLHRRSPLLALAMMLSVFSLAGIPPTVGFTGKLLVFTAAMEKGHFALVLIAMLNVVISLYYYLMVVRAVYLLEPAGDLPPLAVPIGMRLLAGALIGVMIFAGIFPSPFLALAQAAARALMP
jgi:NADH-quinone oxidoreductase subunit N